MRIEPLVPQPQARYVCMQANLWRAKRPPLHSHLLRWNLFSCSPVSSPDVCLGCAVVLVHCPTPFTQYRMSDTIYHHHTDTFGSKVRLNLFPAFVHEILHPLGMLFNTLRPFRLLSILLSTVLWKLKACRRHLQMHNTYIHTYQTHFTCH